MHYKTAHDLEDSNGVLQTTREGIENVAHKKTLSEEKHAIKKRQPRKSMAKTKKEP